MPGKDGITIAIIAPREDEVSRSHCAEGRRVVSMRKVVAVTLRGIHGDHPCHCQGGRGALPPSPDEEGRGSGK